MTRKHWILVASAVLLGGFSLYLNRDWFAKDTIQIYDRSRPARTLPWAGKRDSESKVDPLIFGFSASLKLKTLKVIPLSAIATNEFPHPLWHLVSDSNSVPVKSLFYGQPIRGMRPAVKGAIAEPLEPGTGYRLVIEAESFKGHHDFTPAAKRS